MVDKIAVEAIKNSKGLIIIFWTDGKFRFEGKIINCDDDFLEYFDKHRMATRYVRFSSITDFEVQSS